MKKIFILISLGSVLIISCAPIYHKKKHREEPVSADSTSVYYDKGEYQAVGVAIINRGPKMVQFTLEPSDENNMKTLRPGESHDFPINDLNGILKFQGETSSWRVERHKRYQLMFDQSKKSWYIELL